MHLIQSVHIEITPELRRYHHASYGEGYVHLRGKLRIDGWRRDDEALRGSLPRLCRGMPRDGSVTRARVTIS